MRQTKTLWNFNFILLWLGYLVSSIGDHLNAIAFSLLVLEKTDSVFQVGVVLTTNFIPLIIGSIIAGPFIDRFSAKNIMIYTDIIRGVVLIGFIIYDRLYGSGVTEICFVAAINGFSQAWFAPASQAILRKVVDKEHFVKANSCYQITGQSTEIITKGLSGFAIAFIGPVGLLLIDGISFLLSGISEIFIKTSQETTNTGKFSYFDDLRKGFGYLRSSPGIFFTIIGIGVLNFFMIPGYILMIPLFKQESGLGMELYGIFMSMLAAGLIVGGIMCAKFTKKWHYLLICTSTISTNLVFIAFTFATARWAIITLGFFIGICFAFGRILFDSVILANTKQEFVGRVFCLRGFMIGVLSPISMLLSGYLGEVFPIREVLKYSYALSAIITTMIVIQPQFYRAFKYDHASANEDV